MDSQIDDTYKHFCEIFKDLDNDIIKTVLLSYKKDNDWLDNVINKLSELQEGSEYHFCNAPIENKNDSESKITDFNISKKQLVKNKIQNLFYRFNSKSTKYKKI
jgi:hypothetical protein